ncbi:hypothetical protein [Kribbella catacumbae]|uniref:hypothetical protein n=1 Tax=Kribbella catacumbae TaxID=460086 RepID=UPI00146ED7FC|nr:hypothetical protein [Kribbella catacumbae]
MSQTHQVDVSGEVVTKTYVGWSRDEHLREWTALRVISAARPDLVPVPIRLARPAPLTPQPSITMGRLQGTPMTGLLTAGQLEGLHTALAELWSIPPMGLVPIEHAAFVERIRQAISSWNGSGIIAQAHLAAAEWLAGPTADELERPLNAGFPVDPERLRTARCLWAMFWLTLIRPGGVAAHRNPAGSAELQAERVLGLLETPADRI